jgi:hypothetical protein
MRAALALATPLLLWGCVLTPGSFVSSLTINADRTFIFAYKGQVIAFDPSAAMNGLGEIKPAEGEDAKANAPKPDSSAEADLDAKNRAIAAALMKEAGYRPVVYLGQGKFDIDYLMSGSLTHAFLFPFNADAQAIIPFVMVEVRQGGTGAGARAGFCQQPERRHDGHGWGCIGRAEISRRRVHP